MTIIEWESCLKQTFQAKAGDDEHIVRKLLGKWVSKLEPAIVYDRQGNIIGLTRADMPSSLCEQ